MASQFFLCGWRLVGATGVLIAAMSAAILSIVGTDDAGLRVLLRATAFTSVVLFLLAFTAAPLVEVRPNRFFAWMRANRRHLGVSFAVSHFTHLAAIIALARRSADFASKVETSTLIAGGLGYLILVAMTATSFDRTAARVGPRAWKLLHTTGLYYLWAIFFLTYLPRAGQSTIHVVIIAVLLAALGTRVLRRLPRHPPRLARPAPGLAERPPAATSGTTEGRE